MKKSILALVPILFLFSGCGERIVYVKTKCPKLHTVHVDKPPPISYTVIEK